MTDSVDDGDTVERDVPEFAESASPFVSAETEALFGGYSVVSPGVEIVLQGRAVSAPADD